MIEDTLLNELNRLWEPIRPYLAKQVEEIYGRCDGHILDIGPFAGLIFTLARKNAGQSFLVATFPRGAFLSCRQEAQRLALENKVRIIESDSSLTGVPDDSVDLAIFRGALFFPSRFKVDFGAIHRKLKTGGIAFVGGGFGKYAPPEIISRIGKRSEELNAEMGKVRVTAESVLDQLRAGNLATKAEIITDGGFWVVIKK
jgi:SAM-dependent methyltransferase